MSQMVEVKPSPEARHLFHQMVTLSDDGELSLVNTITLGVYIAREGQDPHVIPEVAELREEGWIRPADGGGWRLGAGVGLGASG